MHGVCIRAQWWPMPPAAFRVSISPYHRALRAATHASNERRAAEAAAAAADRASVTRRERTLQADLESEKDLRVRAQSRVDQLKSELIDQQVLLQQTMDQLEKTREMSEC